VQRDEDEDAWRSIVDNYGDRAEIEDETRPPAPAPPRWSEPEPTPGTPPSVGGAGSARSTGDIGQDSPDGQAERGVDEVDAFVPPDPDLPPAPTRDRQAAWAGLIGAPTLLLVLLLASVQVPSLLAYALIAAFVGGFLYLTFHLPRSTDDPFDDGARL